MIPRAASVAAWRGHPRPLCSHARGRAYVRKGKRRYRHETQGGAADNERRTGAHARPHGLSSSSSFAAASASASPCTSDRIIMVSYTTRHRPRHRVYYLTDERRNAAMPGRPSDIQTQMHGVRR